MKKRLGTLICILVLLSTLTAFAAACGDESFKINFYVGDTAYETVTTGGKEVITLPTDPAKEGYTFAGWFFDGSTTSQLTANTYAELKLKSEVNVYAKWTANDNTIIFDANGGSGAMENSVAKTDSVILLKANAFTRKGYTFAGWATTADGAMAYTDGASYTMKVGGATLFAVWTGNANTVTFNANGGVGTIANQTIKNGATANLTANTFTKHGYEFAGWATTATGEVVYTDGASYTMKVGGATLFAKWTGLNNTLAFDANGGSGATPSRVVKTGDSVVLENQFLRNGYEFAGWATTANGEVIYKNHEIYTMEFGGATLFAKWTANINTIIFYPNCGAIETASQTMMTDETAKLTANTFKRDGYTFAGWATIANGVTVDYTDGASYTMGATNVHLFAKWTANKNTLSFNSNGGVGTMDSLVIETDARVTLALNTTITRDGYTFAGWTTTAKGEVVYKDNANYTMGTTNATLFAVWTANDNTLSFDPNGGVGTIESLVIKTGVTAKLPVNTTIKRDSYTFTCWETANKLINYFDGAYYTMGTSNATLFAIWTANKYTIKFNYDGAEGDTTLTEKAVVADAAFTCPIPTKTGFVFQGWYDGATQYTDNLGVSVATLKGANNAVYNLTAKWVGTAEGMSFVEETTSATLTGYNGTAQYVVIPETYNNKPVTKISARSFSDNNGLKSVTISNNVTFIGISAFSRCRELTSVKIPASVETIKREAFLGCSNLTNFVIEKNSRLTTIEAWAFSNSKIKEFELPASVTTLDCDLNGDTPFTNSNIEKFTVESGNRKFYVEGNCLIDRSTMTLIAGCYDSIIPTNVTAIGNRAFCGTQLSSIVIPDSVTSIGNFAFSYCHALTSITIGSGVKSIGYDAFSECTVLTSITIPRAVTSIENGILNACLALESITVEAGNTKYKSDGNCLIEIATNTLLAGCKTSVIPQGVTSISANAFYYCARLGSITIPDSVTSIGDWAFFGCIALTSFTVGSNVKTIGIGALSECKKLTSVTIPNGVTTIGEKAFYHCINLTSIIIPSTVTTIGEKAFFECAKLATIYCEAADPGAGKQPAGWAANWLGDCTATVGWGYKG